MKRKPISKATRQRVYEKCGGHCAYCGKEISMREMQVDHAIPYGMALYGGDDSRLVEKMVLDDSINNIDNLMPSCRQCNFYKGIDDIETFRHSLMNTLDKTCRSPFQVRLAMQYGMLTYTPWDGKFYYEKIKSNNEDKATKTA